MKVTLYHHSSVMNSFSPEISVSFPYLNISVLRMVLTSNRRSWLIAPFSFSVIQNVVLCLEVRETLAFFLKFFSAHAKMETGKLHYVPTSHFWWGFFVITMRVAWSWCLILRCLMEKHGRCTMSVLWEILETLYTWSMMRTRVALVICALCDLYLNCKHWCWIVWIQSFHPHSCWCSTESRIILIF